MMQPTINHIQQLFKENPHLESAITMLLETAIAKRNYFLEEEDIKGLQLPDEVLDQDDLFIKFDYFLVLYVLLSIAEEKTGEPLPHDPLAAIQYINNFLALIRQPKPHNHWYGNLEENLGGYALVYLNQMYDINVAIPDDSLVQAARAAMPYTNSSVAQLYELLVFLEAPEYVNPYDTSIASLVAQNTEKAMALFLYIAGRNKQLTAYPALLIGLYNTDEPFYFVEAKEYFELDNKHGAWVFTRLNYGSLDELTAVYNLVTHHPNLPELAIANVLATLVSNPHCSAALRATIFEHFIAMATQSSDPDFPGELTSIISYLPGLDEDKLRLFPIFEKFNTPLFYMDWFQRFDKPDGFFRMIRDIYEKEGVDADITRLADCALSIQEAYPGEFTIFLHELMQENTPYGKKAAQTLISFYP
jgi:hypothetical protein